jgi:hypothetical protein
MGGIFRVYTGDNPEYFADGFAAWIYMQSNGAPPNTWILDGYTPNWDAISSAVEWSLSVTLNP